MRRHQSYKVGGSLPLNHPTYVTRQADGELFQAVQQGHFCHILEPHQSGKSSLRIQGRQQLEQAGYICAAVQATEISFSTEAMQSSQTWDKQLIATLWDSLHPGESADIAQWLKATDRLSPLRRLEHFVRDLLFPELLNSPIVIFIDEVDAFLNNREAIHQLMGWIEKCYSIRDQHGEYNTLSFVLLGSTTLTHLKNKALLTFESTAENMHNALETATRNEAIVQLFAIAKRIKLSNFRLNQTRPLIAGLVDKFSAPVAVLQRILDWTNGQPFLTQKLCSTVASCAELLPLLARQQLSQNISQLQGWIDGTVYQNLLQHWQLNDEPVHLRAIRDRLQLSPHQKELLQLYSAIATGQTIEYNGSPIQDELISIGLVTIHLPQALSTFHQQMKITNKVYEHVFQPTCLTDEATSASSDNPVLNLADNELARPNDYPFFSSSYFQKILMPNPAIAFQQI